MPGRTATAGFVAAGLLVALGLVVFVAPLADSNPDGLERVAEDQGFAATAAESATAESPLADYGVAGVADERVGTIVAGVLGTVLVFAVGITIVAVTRRRRSRATPQP